MKAQYFRLQWILVLGFGLISCSSDKSPPPVKPATESKITAEIKNPDQTRQRINETSQLRVDSHIQIDLQKPSQTHSLVQSTCRTNFLHDDLKKETIFKNTLQIPVDESLPLEVFIPNGQKNLQVYCDFTVDTYVDDIHRAQMRLMDVMITGIELYSNFELDFLDPNQPPLFRLSDFKNSDLSLPTSDTQVTTLCSQSKKRSFTSTSSVAFRELFHSFLFANNQAHCRFVVQKNSQTKRWISTDFFIQEHNPSIELVKHEANYKAQLSIDLKNEVLEQIILKNTGQVTSLISIKNIKTQVKARSIYYRRPNFPELGNEFSFVARWTVMGVKPYKKTKKGLVIYKLEPGENLVLELNSEKQIECSLTQITYNLTTKNPETNQCHGLMLFTGIFYQTEKQPLIYVNKFSSTEEIQWENWSPQFKKVHKGGHLSHWAPHQKLNNYCPKIEIPQIIHSPIYPMEVKTPEWYSCLVQ